MQIVAVRPQTLTAIRTDLAAIFVSVELSRSTWLITSLSPGSGEKMSKHSVHGGDVARLLERFVQLREKARTRTGQRFPIIGSMRPGSTDFGSTGCSRRQGLKARC
jgi:transposase